jgi:hypothetical protein
MYEDLTSKNRRLIFFVDRDTGTPPSLRHAYPFLWRFVRESSYGDLLSGVTSTVEERDQSQRATGTDLRTGVLLNHFPRLPFLQDYGNNAVSINSLNMLKIRTIEALRLFGRPPTFLALDHVHRGDGVAFVDALNYRWSLAEADAAAGNPWSVDRWAASIKAI